LETGSERFLEIVLTRFSPRFSPIDLSNIDVSANVHRQAPSVLGGLQTTIMVSMEADLAIGFLGADMGVI
jgi:hypothetical protein